MATRLRDDVEREKEKAAASFERFRPAVGLRQISELLVVFALISWSAGRFPAAVSEYLLNHHVVFLIGNAIIVSLFMICRQSDAAAAADFYDDYVKYSAAAAAAAYQPDPVPSTTAEFGSGGEPAPEESTVGDDREKQLVVRADEAIFSQSDDVAAAVEKAKRQIRKFQRTQSEKLKREISVREPPVFRRSETDNHRKPAEMETLSNEEFKRKVDAFIDAHWRKGTKRIEDYPLLNMA